jgi:RHS repeat-associated protein
VVTNSYTFNSLFQMTGQTVVRGSTTLQNLTYAYSATQNNGQLQSQTDALSGEIVVYQYDQLNRLTQAATPEEPGDPGWEMNFTYDGFGNKLSQSGAEGRGAVPSHSLSINPANNRISMTGFSYDANGNMTAMPNAGSPATTMTYDVANRMVRIVHHSAGIHEYGYNHANQRVFQHTSSTAFGTLNRRFSLYGFGGELLLEANRTGSGVQPHTGEVVRYVYFLGRKMFASVNRGPLRAAVPNRLGSRSEHFPYGEQKGAAPPEGDKDYFTTYRRDETGLDYAWNRYYAPSVGRFTTADPLEPFDPLVPTTWNLFAYVRSDPIQFIDPEGLDVKPLTFQPGEPTCYSERFLSDVSTNINRWLNSDVGTLALQVFFEYSASGVEQRNDEMWAALAHVYRNRWLLSPSVKASVGFDRKANFKSLLYASAGHNWWKPNTPAGKQSHWNKDGTLKADALPAF